MITWVIRVILKTWFLSVEISLNLFNMDQITKATKLPFWRNSFENYYYSEISGGWILPQDLLMPCEVVWKWVRISFFWNILVWNISGLEYSDLEHIWFGTFCFGIHLVWNILFWNIPGMDISPNFKVSNQNILSKLFWLNNKSVRSISIIPSSKQNH